MKKKFKILGLTLSACMAFGLAAFASGCSAKDKTDKWFEQLFCEHKYDEGVETQAPTCTEEGVLTYTCTECGKTKKKDIAMIEHTEVEIPSVSPTCTEVGYAGGICCEVCELVIVEQTELVALGHLEIPDKAVAATCTTSGLTEGKHCKRCNEVLKAQEKVPATGHMDSNGDLLCDICGIKALNEVTPTKGECVAGNTYRVYFPQDDSSPNLLYLSNDTKAYFYINSARTENSYLWWSDGGCPLYYLEGLEVVKTDTYFEFNLKAGTYKILKNDGTDTGDTYVIDDTTTINSFDDGYVYRVEF